MCSNQEITLKSLVSVANFKGHDHNKYIPKHQLKNDLGWDDIGLAYLAMNLRSLILSCNGIGSIYTPELRKSKFSLGSLVALMINRTNGSEPSDAEINQLFEQVLEG